MFTMYGCWLLITKWRYIRNCLCLSLYLSYPSPNDLCKTGTASGIRFSHLCSPLRLYRSVWDGVILGKNRYGFVDGRSNLPIKVKWMILWSMQYYLSKWLTEYLSRWAWSEGTGIRNYVILVLRHRRKSRSVRFIGAIRYIYISNTWDQWGWG